MSNLKAKFHSKLDAVTVHAAKNGRLVFTAFFADNTSAVIRTSDRAYASVAQVKNNVGTVYENSEFIFSSKAAPALGSYQQARLMAVVQVQPAAPGGPHHTTPYSN